MNIYHYSSYYIESNSPCNLGVASLYVNILYPWSFNLHIISFWSLKALCGSLGCKAIRIICGFTFIKSLFC